MNQHHSRSAIDANLNLSGAPRRSEVTFIESNVPDLATLLSGLAGKEVHVLDAGGDGLQQIAAILAGRSGIDAVHIITHGDSGAVDLGALTLTSGNLAAHQADLQSIGASLSADGDILLYGCEIGAGADGAALLRSLATLTGADLAASTNLTGVGGDWTLEARSGHIESAAPLSVPAMLDYHGTLATGTPLEPEVHGDYNSNVGSAQLSNGGHADLYLHQIGGNSGYAGAPPQYEAKVVLADGDNHIVQTVTVSAGAEYVTNASVAKLVNGGFVVAWTVDDSVTHDGSGAQINHLYYRVYDNAGVAQGAAQPLTSVEGKSVALTALADGGFAAAFIGPHRADSLVVYGYNNGVFSRGLETLGDGDSVASYTNDTDTASNVWSLSDTNGGTPSIVQLTNGDIVVTDSVYVYKSSMYTPLGQYAFKYTATGAAANFDNGYHTQRLNWSMDGASNTGQHAIALSGGGFAVVSLVSLYGGATAYELIVLNNDGTPRDAGKTVTHEVNLPGNNNVHAPKTYFAQSIKPDTPDDNLQFGWGRFTLAESSDGHILLALPNSGNNGLDIHTYTQAGVAVGAPVDAGVTPAPGTSLEHLVLAPHAGGGFSLSYNEAHYDVALYEDPDNSDNNYEYWLYTGTPYSYSYVPNTAPAFVGAATSAAAAQNGVAIDVASLLHAGDADAGQTLTWSQSVGPTHGTLSFTTPTAGSGGADIAPGGTIIYTPNAGYAGSDSFTVQISDGAASATRVITVNVTPTAPTTPVLAPASDSGTSHSDHLTNSATLSFSGGGGAGDSASTVRVFIDVDGNGGYNSGDIAGSATLSNGGWTVSGLSTSTLADSTYHVYASTSAGALTSALSAALDVTIDKTAPTISFSALTLSVDSGAAGDFITNTAAQTVSATLSAAPAVGDVVEGTIDGGAHWIDISSMVSGTALSWTGVALNASGTLQLRVTDKAGNSSTAQSHAYTIDSGVPAAPATPTLDAASDSGTLNNDRVTSVATPELTGHAEANASVRLYDGGGNEVGATSADNMGNWSITSSTLSDGGHDLTVKQSDAAGNVSADSSALHVVIDTTAPTAIALSAGAATEAGAVAGATVATLSATDANMVGYSLVNGSAGNDASNALFSIVGNALKPIANLAVGTYHVYVDAADAAGNHAGQALTFVVANGPTVSSIARADGGGDDLVAGAATSLTYTVTFSEAVTGVDAGDFTLTTTGSAGGAIVGPITGSGATYTVTVNALAGEGTLALGLKASGTGIQNAGATAIIGGYNGGQVLTLDHSAAAPATPILDAASDSGAPGDGVSNHATPVFSGTAEANATVRLYDSNGSTELGDTTADGDGHWSITSAALSEGTHTLTVKQTDLAGNVSAASGGFVYKLDTTAPSAIALGGATIALSSAVNGATLTTLSASDAGAVGFSLAAGDTFNDFDNGKFSIVGGNLVAAQNLGVGSYHLRVKATDVAGNESLQSLVVNVVDAPGVVAIVRAGGASSTVATAATSVSYTITFSQAVTGVDATDFLLSASGNAVGTIGSVSAVNPIGGASDTYTVTVTGISGDGTLRLDLKGSGTNIKNGSAVDIVGGHEGNQTYRLDHTAAAAPSTPAMTAGTDSGSVGDAITSNTTPVFTGTAEANATVKLYDSNGTTLLGTTSADGSGNWSISSGTLSEGGHTLTVKQTDAAGNVSLASGGLAVVIDTGAAAPSTPVLAGASDSGVVGDRVTNVATPTITGSAEANATVKLYDSDGITLLGTTTANGSGAWSVVSGTLGDGVHSLTVKQTDRAGNVSAASAALTLTIDTVAPNAPSAPVLATASDSGVVGDGVTNVDTPVVTGTADANATVKLYDTNGTTVLGTAVANGAGVWSISSGALTVGAHSLTVKQFDLAGNASPAGGALALTIEAAPVAPTTPPTTIDGVPVTQQPVTLPGGGSGTQIVIPVVTPGRDESSGNAGVADIPLASNGGANVLLAQVAPGFGLTATGGASQPAGSSTEQLIQAILAATPDHPSSDQGHLTGNGVVFLAQLASTVPLLVQTITPTGGATTAGGALTLTGTSTDAQHTALVIDTSNLAPGAKLVLNAVDFAAIVGAADVTGNTTGQILTGDLASQQFTVGAGSSSSVFAGGGSDTLVFNTAAAVAGAAAGGPGAGVHGATTQGATLPAGTTILHGGLGDDAATFNGASADYTVVSHDGYVVVTANAQPNQHALVINAESLKFSDATVAVVNREALGAITGLYQDVLGRQADYLGVEFWATAEKNGVSLGKIALDLIGSAESQGKHAMVFNGDSAHDVELLYQGIFSRASDADGLAFWVDHMAKGMTLVQVANGFMASAEITGHKIGVQDWDFQMG